MHRHIHWVGAALLFGAMMIPAPAFAQAPPKPKPPAMPHATQSGPSDCVNTRATEGNGKSGVHVQQPGDQSLSSRLAQSNGVICPPSEVDPNMRKPAPGGGNMPVIPPPGTRGGKPGPQAK